MYLPSLFLDLLSYTSYMCIHIHVRVYLFFFLIFCACKLNFIRALSAFEQHDGMEMVRECLESQQDSRSWTRDPDIFPLWDPKQLLNTSELLLLRAATLQTEYSDDDDTSSVASDEYTSK